MGKYAMSLVLLIVLTVPGVAKAQEKGQVGVTFASPASVGLLFHPTDSLAVRPDFTFSRSSSDSTSTSVSGSSTSTAIGLGIAALFYARTWEHLKVYFTPRFSYARSTSHNSGTSTSAISGSTVTSTSQNTGNTYSGSGSVGAQYTLSGRFGVFAETGIVYSRVTSSASGTSTLSSGPVSSASGHANTWSTRAGIGAVVYF